MPPVKVFLCENGETSHADCGVEVLRPISRQFAADVYVESTGTLWKRDVILAKKG